MEIFLALGSNLDNRLANLNQAISRLDFIYGLKCSPIIETAAILLPDSPIEWNLPYLNMMVVGRCDLEPHEVLNRIKQIEMEMGRDLESSKWSPRKIDIDIVKYGNINLASEILTIPHAELENREFWKNFKIMLI